MNSLLLLALVLVVGIYIGTKLERNRTERERDSRIAEIGRGKLKNF